MRSIHVLILVVAGLSVDAAASPHSGGGSGDSGGGRLGQVSKGIAGATSSGSSSSSGGGHGTTTTTTDARDWGEACFSDQYRRRLYDGYCERRCPMGADYRPSDGA